MALDRRTLLAAAAALASAPAWAQSEPPLRLIVPFTPGTGIDLIARQVGPHLSERLGRPVVVDNRAGASGNIGTEAVVRAPADGNTLLVTVNTLVMNRALYPRLSFDPVRDLEPITLTSWGTLLLVANAKTGIATAQDLIARAKARPGALNYASPGAGTPHHLAMELLKNRTGSFITHIPYRGTGPAVTDLLGGQVDVMFLPIHVALQHVQAGTLKALAISSPRPSPLLPAVPPLSELNLGEIDVEMWYGVLAPKGTPAPVIERLNRELRDILARPDVKTAFETQGMQPTHSTPDAFRRRIEADARRWAELIAAQGIKAE
ncbi:MAG: tripartite tricarboxylate transporter substrate binding protein [Ideonella sp.]|jgi:tripartite-type tricarboxylate transporter receptor subunit TctC|nr:tripartite tricarboxylate transporter substrate binding protein [Ideonella sp.]